MTKEKDTDFIFPINSLVGSRIGNYRNIIAKHSVHKGYYIRYVLTTAISGILTPMASLEKLLSIHKVHKVEIVDNPVFIIGFWRSGTTLLHNLLCLDPNSAYISTFQSVFPNHTLINQGWLSVLAKILMPKYRPVDKIKLDLSYPQEEEISLGNLQELSFYHFFYFPADYEYYLRNSLLMTNSTDNDIEAFSLAYKKLIQTALLNTGGNRFISKNPPNTFRIKLIREMYPNARFIFIHRNPYESITSFQRFLIPVLDGIKLQDYNKEELKSKIPGLYKMFFEIYERDKSMLDEKSLVEVKYEDLLNDGISEIENIYSKLEIDGFSRNKDALARYLAKQKEHKSGSYQLSERSIRMINDEVADIISNYGYKLR